MGQAKIIRDTLAKVKAVDGIVIRQGTDGTRRLVSGPEQQTRPVTPPKPAPRPVTD